MVASAFSRAGWAKGLQMLVCWFRAPFRGQSADRKPQTDADRFDILGV
jgi:hypothetical protein